MCKAQKPCWTARTIISCCDIRIIKFFLHTDIRIHDKLSVTKCRQTKISDIPLCGLRGQNALIETTENYRKLHTFKSGNPKKLFSHLNGMQQSRHPSRKQISIHPICRFDLRLQVIKCVIFCKNVVILAENEKRRIRLSLLFNNGIKGLPQSMRTIFHLDGRNDMQLELGFIHELQLYRKFSVFSAFQIGGIYLDMIHGQKRIIVQPSGCLAERIAVIPLTQNTN